VRGCWELQRGFRPRLTEVWTNRTDSGTNRMDSASSGENERTIHLKLFPGAVCHCNCGKNQKAFYPLRVGRCLAVSICAAARLPNQERPAEFRSNSIPTTRPTQFHETQTETGGGSYDQDEVIISWPSLEAAARIADDPLCLGLRREGPPLQLGCCGRGA